MSADRHTKAGKGGTDPDETVVSAGTAPSDDDLDATVLSPAGAGTGAGTAAAGDDDDLDATVLSDETRVSTVRHIDGIRIVTTPAQSQPKQPKRPKPKQDGTDTQAKPDEARHKAPGHGEPGRQATDARPARDKGSGAAQGHAQGQKPSVRQPAKGQGPATAGGPAPDGKPAKADRPTGGDATQGTPIDDDTHVVDVQAGAPPLPAPPKLPLRPGKAKPGKARQNGQSASQGPRTPVRDAAPVSSPVPPRITRPMPTPTQPKPTPTQPTRPTPTQPKPSALPTDDTRVTNPTRPAATRPAAGTTGATGMDMRLFQQRFDTLVANISQAVVGKERPVRLVVTALLAGGHVLLEDNPGTGKTQLARALANSIDAPFKRIQFTPDLLPADVDGTTIYNQKTGELTFRPGPVFASIVLADEINRASPKTQSAMLEVMEEQKVTVDGETYEVPQPFIVIATQNPIEQLGTYRLPEAQMDRFLIKTSVGYPSAQVSVDILRQMDVTDRAARIEPVMDGDEVLALRHEAEAVHMDDALLQYVVLLVEGTRDSESTVVGSSMRGALALARCARIWAASEGRAYVVPDDVKNLAVAVLAHRVTLTPDATFAGKTSEQVVEQVLRDVVPPELGA